MKNFIYFILGCMAFMGTSLSLQAQSLTPHDPAISNANIMLGADGTGFATFEFIQLLSDYPVGEKIAPLQMTICFMNVAPKEGVNAIKGLYADHFDWQYDEGLKCLLATQTKKLVANQLGILEIDILQTNKIPCTDGEKMGFNVNLQPAACMNGINDIGNDNTSVYTCAGIVSSTIETEKLSYTVFPNPSKDVVTIQLNESVPQLDVELFNIHGQIVATYSFEHIKSQVLNIQGIPSGLYTLKIQTEHQKAIEKITIIND